MTKKPFVMNAACRVLVHGLPPSITWKVCQPLLSPVTVFLPAKLLRDHSICTPRRTQFDATIISSEAYLHPSYLFQFFNLFLVFCCRTLVQSGCFLRRIMIDKPCSHRNRMYPKLAPDPGRLLGPYCHSPPLTANDAAFRHDRMYFFVPWREK